MAISTAAAAGPTRFAVESRSPRTTFALVSSRPVRLRVGSSAECAGRYSVAGTAAAAVSTNTIWIGPDIATTEAAARYATPRTVATATSTRSRRPRSARGASSGVRNAEGATVISPTRPTASGPPAMNAATLNATVNAHPAVHSAKKLSCARRRLGFRQLLAKAAPASTSLPQILRPMAKL